MHDCLFGLVLLHSSFVSSHLPSRQRSIRRIAGLNTLILMYAYMWMDGYVTPILPWPLCEIHVSRCPLTGLGISNCKKIWLAPFTRSNLSCQGLPEREGGKHLHSTSDRRSNCLFPSELAQVRGRVLIRFPQPMPTVTKPCYLFSLL